MLNACVYICASIQLKFNPDKSFCIVFGRNVKYNTLLDKSYISWEEPVSLSWCLFCKPSCSFIQCERNLYASFNSRPIQSFARFLEQLTQFNLFSFRLPYFVWCNAHIVYEQFQFTTNAHCAQCYAIMTPTAHTVMELTQHHIGAKFSRFAPDLRSSIIVYPLTLDGGFR